VAALTLEEEAGRTRVTGLLQAPARKPIAALILDGRHRHRLQRSLAGCAPLLFCRRREHLYDLTQQLLSAVIVEAHDESGAPLAPVVRDLKRGMPSLAVLAYVEFTPDHAHDILTLARAGIDDVILRGREDPRSVLNAISRSIRYSAAAHALSELSPIIGQPLVPFLAYCLSRVDEPLSVRAAAAALGVHRKTLAQRARASSAPTPSVLIVWCRLLIAGRLLEDPHRTVDQVASVLQFGSSSALRNVFRRYARLRPNEVRQQGGFRVVLEACKDALCIEATARARSGTHPGSRPPFSRVSSIATGQTSG
jgi:AraC-like DNA-binding protein